MAFQHQPLGMLVATNPDEAARKINAALAREGGLVLRAATRLGVGHTSLKRWIAKLGTRIRARAPRGGVPGNRARARKPQKTRQLAAD